MADLQQAADAVIQFAEKLSPIIDVADVLKKLGSLEQATAERKAAYEEAAKAHDGLVASNEEAAQRLADVNQSIEKLQVDAAADAKATGEATRADAEQVKLAARADADNMLANAKRDTAAVLKAREDELENFAKLHDELRGQIKDAQEVLASLSAQQVAVQGQIDGLKKTAQNILS